MEEVAAAQACASAVLAYEAAAAGATIFRWPTIADMQGLGLKEFLDTVEANLLAEALKQSGGVRNQAAELLGIKRTTLIEKLKKLAVEG